MHYLRHRKGYRPSLIHGDTDLVMDGFPRSANSYARYAFMHSNPARGLAGHTHSAQLILEGARLGLPVMVLVRHPIDCTSSYAKWLDTERVTPLLRAYIRFHETVLQAGSAVCIAPFNEVVTDFGQSIDRCNRFFGTDFVPYSKSSAAERRVLAAVDNSAREHHGWLDPTKVARPNAERGDITAADLHELDQRQTALAERAQELYTSMTLHQV